jgi:hypothetical protein
MSVKGQAMRKDRSGFEAQSIFRKAKPSITGTADVKKYRTGLELLKRAATLDHVGAHEWMGAEYDYGLGTRPNRRRHHHPAKTKSHSFSEGFGHA